MLLYHFSTWRVFNLKSSTWKWRLPILISAFLPIKMLSDLMSRWIRWSLWKLALSTWFSSRTFNLAFNLKIKSSQNSVCIYLGKERDFSTWKIRGFKLNFQVESSSWFFTHECSSELSKIHTWCMRFAVHWKVDSILPSKSRVDTSFQIPCIQEPPSSWKSVSRWKTDSSWKTGSSWSLERSQSWRRGKVKIEMWKIAEFSSWIQDENTIVYFYCNFCNYLFIFADWFVIHRLRRKHVSNKILFQVEKIFLIDFQVETVPKCDLRLCKHQTAWRHWDVP